VEVRERSPSEVKLTQLGLVVVLRGRGRRKGGYATLDGQKGFL